MNIVWVELDELDHYKTQPFVVVEKWSKFGILFTMDNVFSCYITLIKTVALEHVRWMLATICSGILNRIEGLISRTTRLILLPKNVNTSDMAAPEPDSKCSIVT